MRAPFKYFDLYYINYISRGNLFLDLFETQHISYGTHVLNDFSLVRDWHIIYAAYLNIPDMSTLARSRFRHWLPRKLWIYPGSSSEERVTSHWTSNFSLRILGFWKSTGSQWWLKHRCDFVCSPRSLLHPTSKNRERRHHPEYQFKPNDI